jgi:hypothetical protein
LNRIHHEVEQDPTIQRLLDHRPNSQWRHDQSLNTGSRQDVVKVDKQQRFDSISELLQRINDNGSRNGHDWQSTSTSAPRVQQIANNMQNLATAAMKEDPIQNCVGCAVSFWFLSLSLSPRK